MKSLYFKFLTILSYPRGRLSVFLYVVRKLAAPLFQTEVQKYIINFKHDNIAPFLFQNITHTQKRRFQHVKNKDLVTPFPYFMITFATNVTLLCNRNDLLL